MEKIDKKNPYTLLWYKQGWSQNKIKMNNANYWNWEIVHNGFIPPNSTIKKEQILNQNK